MTTAELERPAIDRRQRAALEPVSHGGDEIGALLPTVRRCDDTVTHPARRRGPAFHGEGSATAWIVAGGLARLDDVSRRRVADGWRGLHRGHGAGLVVDGGCDVRVGRVPLGAAAREGLLHWLPISHIELALLDDGLFADDPAGAIALLVRPPTIWRLDDARRAELLFPRAPRFEPQRFAAIEEWARREIDTEHLTRLRAAVQRIEAQLPVPDLATASATVAAGCTVIAEDDDRCVAVAARQLARCASSVVLTRQLRDPGHVSADTRKAETRSRPLRRRGPGEIGAPASSCTLDLAIRRSTSTLKASTVEPTPGTPATYTIATTPTPRAGNVKLAP